jgi:hypothetical protein
MLYKNLLVLNEILAVTIFKKIFKILIPFTLGALTVFTYSHYVEEKDEEI